MHDVFVWIEANPIATLAVVVWAITNFAPRPHPEDCVGWRKVFWQVVDRLCVLTAKEFPGVLKLPFSDSPYVRKPKPASLGTAVALAKPKAADSDDDGGVSVEVVESTEEDTDKTRGQKP